jgi:hypothetical protein
MIIPETLIFFIFFMHLFSFISMDTREHNVLWLYCLYPLYLQTCLSYIQILYVCQVRKNPLKENESWQKWLGKLPHIQQQQQPHPQPMRNNSCLLRLLWTLVWGLTSLVQCLYLLLWVPVWHWRKGMTFTWNLIHCQNIKYSKGIITFVVVESVFTAQL